MASTFVHSGLWVIWMTPEAAERHTRKVMNIPEDSGIGWQPYQVLVNTPNCLSYCAFRTMLDFRRWVGDHRVEFKHMGLGVRLGRIYEPLHS